MKPHIAIFMRQGNHYRLTTGGIIMFFLVLLCLSACKDKVKIEHRIVAIANLGGAGDNGYNDVIMNGFENIYVNKDNATEMYIHIPKTKKEAQYIAEKWTRNKQDDIPTLVILGASDYSDIALDIISDKSIKTTTSSILLYEVDEMPASANSVNCYTFLISMYGPSYKAGKYVAEKGLKAPLIWLAYNDPQLRYAASGFRDGYFEATGNETEIAYLSNDWTGYSMPDSAYRAMPEMSKKYDFLYPVMGGSNMGIFRYLREYEEGPYVAGMDVDQSQYSSKVIGNMIKHIDVVIENYVRDWVEHRVINHHNVYDTESGYVEWMPVNSSDHPIIM